MRHMKIWRLTALMMISAFLIAAVPFSVQAACTHPSKTAKRATAHPHASYYRCDSCNEIVGNIASSNYVESCATCNPPSTPTATPTACTHASTTHYRAAAHPHATYRKCNNCGVITEYTAASSYKEDCATCNSTPTPTPTSSTCTHPLKTAKRATAHPHASYYRCDICNEIVGNIASSNYVENCATCIASPTPTPTNCTHPSKTAYRAKAHPHGSYYKCDSCGANLGEKAPVNPDPDCSQCNAATNACTHDTTGSSRYASPTDHPHSIYRKCNKCGAKVYDGTAMSYPDSCSSCVGSGSTGEKDKVSVGSNKAEGDSAINTDTSTSGNVTFVMDINDVKKGSESGTRYRTIGMTATVNGVSVTIPIAGHQTDGDSTSESNQWAISIDDMLARAARQYGTNSLEYKAFQEFAAGGGTVRFDAIQTTVTNGQAAGAIDENGRTSGTVYTDLEGIQDASNWSDKAKNEDLPKYYDNQFTVTPPAKDDENENEEPPTPTPEDPTENPPVNPTPTPAPTPTPPPGSTPTPTPTPASTPTPTPGQYPDLTVTAIRPTVVRPNTTAMTLVTVTNWASTAVSGAVVKLTVNGKTYATTVNLGVNQTLSVPLNWPTPSSGSYPATATINDNKAITETNYANNTKTEVITVKGYNHAREIPNPVPIPAPPPGDNNPTVTWVEGGKTYTARLTLSAGLSPSQMKSGYGLTATLTATVTTNYPDTSKIMPVQLALMFVPEEQYQRVVYFDRVSASGLTTTWQLEVHGTSVTGARKWFVPVWFPDRDYTVLISAYGAYTPGGELTASMKRFVTIKGNMHEDDVTGWN